ncbi:MAG: hypothetical protein J5714_03135 [Alphaproteobacteria bacterium]|nr:hypothetical protein [Alphaproteobacteria bacterium]
MTENRKRTFAQQAIVNRIAQKTAMEPKKGFQDYTEHTDYEAYTDYSEAWHQFINANGEPEGDYCESHGDYCDFAVENDDGGHSYFTGATPSNVNIITVSQKPNLLQRIFCTKKQK